MKVANISRYVFPFLLAALVALVALKPTNAAALRRNADDLEEMPLGEASALDDWDVVANHGRELQPTNLKECLDNLPPAFCSCVFIDGNGPQYCGICGQALAQSGFALRDTDSFDKWFTDDSKLVLPQTGTYKGTAGIKEYVNFIYSIIFDDYQALDVVTKFLPNPDFATDGICIITQAIQSKFVLNQDLHKDTCYTTTIGTALYYQPTSADNNYINVVEVRNWYPAGIFEAIFENFKREAVAEWLCDTVEEYCPGTWEHNNFDNNDNKCMANYLSLPETEGDLSYIDGKTFGCKVLHATFVSLNPFHCAHTSFKKQEDPNGDVKCQKSNGVTPESVFSDEMLSFFKTVGVERFGYDAEVYFDASPETC